MLISGFCYNEMLSVATARLNGPRGEYSKGSPGSWKSLVMFERIDVSMCDHIHSVSIGISVELPVWSLMWHVESMGCSARDLAIPNGGAHEAY